MGPGESGASQVKQGSVERVAPKREAMTLMSDCPLITAYTEELKAPHKLLEYLYQVRQHDIEDGPIDLPRPSCIRDVALVSQKPFNLKVFQTQMAAHLMRMPRFINGDGVGLGKSASSIYAASYLHEKHGGKPKILVFGTKSTTYQWKVEGFDEFTTLNTTVMEDTYQKKSGFTARIKQLQEFFDNPEANVLIMKYTSLIGQRAVIQGDYDAQGNPAIPGSREPISQEMLQFLSLMEAHKDHLICIFDESQKFKNPNSQVWKLVSRLSRNSRWCWAMTATAIQNNLEEFYAIAGAIGIRPFGSMEAFKQHFCRYEEAYIGHGRTTDKLIGYKNVKDFKIEMRPFYYGRSQAQVKEKLPRLVTHYCPIDLSKSQIKLLEDLKHHRLQLPPSVKRIGGEWVEHERDINNKMTQMAVLQQICNHPCLLYPDPKAWEDPKLSPKEEALQELMDGEYAGEKILVFSKSKRWIDRFEWLCQQRQFTKRPFLRITGDESEAERARNKQLFQTQDNYNLMFINTAIMEGANLQQSAHMVLMDAPWGWGALIQLVGRMVRMYSPHLTNTLHVMVGKGTIDEYTINTLTSKKGVFEKILGASHSAGLLDTGLDAGADLDLASGMETMNDAKEFRELLWAHMASTPLSSYLSGVKIQEAVQEGENYVMAYEQKQSSKKWSAKFNFNDKWRIE